MNAPKRSKAGLLAGLAVVLASAIFVDTNFATPADQFNDELIFYFDQSWRWVLLLGFASLFLALWHYAWAD